MGWDWDLGWDPLRWFLPPAGGLPDWDGIGIWDGIRSVCFSHRRVVCWIGVAGGAGSQDWARVAPSGGRRDGREGRSGDGRVR